MPDDALELVTLRNNFYRDNYRRVLLVLLISILLNAGLAGIIFYQRTHIPTPAYFATSGDGRVIQLQPLSAPVLKTDALLAWANRAAVAAYSYNFVNYREALQTASEYFTAEGWNNYEAALKASRNLDTVLAKKLVVTAVATGAPTVLDQRVVNGRYAWKISMPLLVSYRSASTSYQQPVVVTMVITRVPTLETPRGIAIAQFISAQQTTLPG